jgi:hypothetical protein
MAVAVQGQGRGLVAQQLLNPLQVRAGADRQRRARMAQIVQSGPLQPMTAAANFWNAYRACPSVRYSLPRADGNTSPPPSLVAISVSSSFAKDSGTGTVRLVWFFVGPSTNPVLRTYVTERRTRIRRALV